MIILLLGNISKQAILLVTERIKCHSLATEQVGCQVFVREQIGCYFRRKSRLDIRYISVVKMHKNRPNINLDHLSFAANTEKKMVSFPMKMNYTRRYYTCQER